MNKPIAIKIMLPLLFLFILISNYFGKDYLFWFFVPVFFILILLEMSSKYGKLSLKTIIKFFNTPIIQKHGFGGEPVVDTSPQVSMFKGIWIILGGTLVVVSGLIFIFGFILE